MSSIGESAVRGLETGFLMGSRVVSARQAEQDRLQRERDAQQQRADLTEERAYQRTRQKAQDARLASQDERQRRLDELKLLDTELADLQAEGQGLFSQFGGYDKVPEDVRGDYTGRVRALHGRRGQLRQSFYGSTVEEQRRAAAETWARIQSGQMTADQLSGDDLVRTLTAQTGRPLSDYLGGRDGSPSVVRQAILDVEAGLQAGNRDLLLRGANALLQRELSTGVGTEGRDGSEIVGKKLVELVPHPQDPNRVVPILEVTVRRDDGALGKYRAPVTDGRGVYSTDPGAMPKALTVQELMERLGHVGAMEAWLNDPETRRRIESASPQAKASADEFLQALGAIGVARPKSKITRERVDLGDRIEEREVDDATGKVLSVRHLGKGLAPTRRAEGGPSADERSLDRAVTRGLVTPAERDKRLREMALGAGGKGQMTSPADLFKAENSLRDEHTKQSGTFVKIRDAYGKLQAAARSPSAAGDIALIFGYMRMLDPDSVVREGEFATAQNAASIPDRIRNLYNRAVEGERLNDKQRADMVEQARKVYGEQKRGQDKLDRTYTDLANRYGLNPDNVVQRFELDGDRREAPPAALEYLRRHPEARDQFRAKYGYLPE